MVFGLYSFDFDFMWPIMPWPEKLYLYVVSFFIFRMINTTFLRNYHATYNKSAKLSFDNVYISEIFRLLLDAAFLYRLNVTTIPRTAMTVLSSTCIHLSHIYSRANGKRKVSSSTLYSRSSWRSARAINQAHSHLTLARARPFE